MIFIPSKNFLYLRVPKTGSTSTTHNLLENLDSIEDLQCSQPENFITVDPIKINVNLPVHGKISNLIKTGLLKEENVCNLKTFSVIRDPVDRLISVAWDSVPAEIAEKYTTDYIVEYYFENYSYDEPQVEFLKYNGQLISNIYAYENLDVMMKDIANYLNINYNPIKYRHRSERRKNKLINLTSTLVNKIYQIYENDLILYRAVTKNKDKNDKEINQ